MRLIIISHGLGIGGAEVLIADLARMFKRKGHDVLLANLDYTGVLGEQLEAEGFKTFCLNRKPGFDIALVFRLAKLLKECRADYVHAHQYSCFMYCALACFLVRVPYCFTEHGRFYPDGSNWKKRFFNRLFQHTAHSITAVSQGVKQSLVRVENFSPEKIQVVYNGIRDEPVTMTAESIKIKKTELGIPERAGVVTIIGRLDSIKNHSYLFAVFKRLLEVLPESILLVIGAGQTHAHLVGLSEKMGIKSSVKLLGERRDIYELLFLSDVMVLSSLSEGTPMTLLEAMMVGTPIVSTDVGGIPEIVRHGETALLVPSVEPEKLFNPDGSISDSVKPMTKALLTLLTDKPLLSKLSGNARKEFIKKFQLDGITNQYLEIFTR